MIDGKEILVIIPARAGSKGLLNKNIKNFCGKPLIAWTIEAALKSKYVDKVIVSTDSTEIARIANQFGQLAVFIRPPELSTDTASSIEVVKHASEFLRINYSEEYYYLALLEPTSPLRETSDIDLAIFELNSIKASSIVGISNTESQNPAFLVNRNEKGLISWYSETHKNGVRRQDISQVYYLEGSLYISERNKLFEKNSFYHEETVGHIMHKSKALEIDDEYDFIMAEALMRYRIENK